MKTLGNSPRSWAFVWRTPPRHSGMIQSLFRKERLTGCRTAGPVRAGVAVRWPHRAAHSRLLCGLVLTGARHSPRHGAALPRALFLFISWFSRFCCHRAVSGGCVGERVPSPAALRAGRWRLCALARTLVTTGYLRALPSLLSLSQTDKQKVPYRIKTGRPAESWDHRPPSAAGRATATAPPRPPAPPGLPGLRCAPAVAEAPSPTLPCAGAGAPSHPSRLPPRTLSSHFRDSCT